MINARNSPLFEKGKEKWDAYVASYQGEYDFSGSIYAGMNRKIQFCCPAHGVQTSDAKNLMAGRKCQLCAFEARKGKSRITQGKMLIRFAETHGDTYDYSEAVYKGQQTPVKILCKYHGQFWQKPEYHWAGSKCPLCASRNRNESLKDTKETLETKVALLFGGLFDLSDVSYSHSQQIITVRCSKHNQLCQTRPNWLVNGANPCTKCNHMKSSGEEELAEFLAQYTCVERRNRKILAPKEIDIWLPEHNVGIEFHGVYWHSVDRVGNIHREKWETAQSIGIRLVQIFQDEWADKSCIVKDRLLSILGRGAKYDARKCELLELPAREANTFLGATHIQGGCQAPVHYGLLYGGLLIAVASFGPARSGAMTKGSDGNVWEVIRYASLGRVRGGFSKLLTRFEQDIAPAKIVSYCDLRYGDGRLYAATGFLLECITDPDYWWCDPKNSRRVSRYQTQKHKLPAHPVLKNYYHADKTETEICTAAGWVKILGVGNQRWIKSP